AKLPLTIAYTSCLCLIPRRRWPDARYCRRSCCAWRPPWPRGSRRQTYAPPTTSTTRKRSTGTSTPPAPTAPHGTPACPSPGAPSTAGPPSAGLPGPPARHPAASASSDQHGDRRTDYGEDRRPVQQRRPGPRPRHGVQQDRHQRAGYAAGPPHRQLPVRRLSRQLSMKELVLQ
uniref:Uncharacterized protein n=1 Tax=Triticum urartu TaxID=4572 RepID=A0A8R7QTV0_TRIUA